MKYNWKLMKETNQLPPRFHTETNDSRLESS